MLDDGLRYLLLALIATINFACETDPNPASATSWRFPNERDMSDDWKTFETEFPEPYHVSADFDGNGVSDDMRIVIDSGGEGWRLISMMNDSDEVITLTSSTAGLAQWYGIQLVEPGSYQTACGKGYWDCGPNEPEQLLLTRPAVRFFRFESASTLFYWNSETGSFAEVAESD